MLLGLIFHIKDIIKTLYEVKGGLYRFTPFVCGNLQQLTSGCELLTFQLTNWTVIDTITKEMRRGLSIVIDI